MFVKIVSRKSEEEPEENRIFEASNIFYKKVTVDSKKELEEMASIPYILIGTIPEDVQKDGSFEYIDLHFKEKEGSSRSIIAVNCSIYLLNQEGRNVDSIHC